MTRDSSMSPVLFCQGRCRSKVKHCPTLTQVDCTTWLCAALSVLSFSSPLVVVLVLFVFPPHPCCTSFRSRCALHGAGIPSKEKQQKRRVNLSLGHLPLSHTDRNPKRPHVIWQISHQFLLSYPPAPASSCCSQEIQDLFIWRFIPGITPSRYLPQNGIRHPEEAWGNKTSHANRSKHTLIRCTSFSTITLATISTQQPSTAHCNPIAAGAPHFHARQSAAHVFQLSNLYPQHKTTASGAQKQRPHSASQTPLNQSRNLHGPNACKEGAPT